MRLARSLYPLALAPLLAVAACGSDEIGSGGDANLAVTDTAVSDTGIQTDAGITGAIGLPPCAGLGDDDECAELGDGAADGDVDAIKSIAVKDAATLVVTLGGPGAPLPPFLAADRVLFGNRKADRPFLRRIRSVSRSGAIVTLATEQASLEDAFKELRLKRQVPAVLVETDTNARSIDDGVGMQQAPLGPENKDCSFDLVDSNNLYVGLKTCSFTATVDVIVDLRISLTKPDYFVAKLVGDLEIVAKAVAEAQVSKEVTSDPKKLARVFSAPLAIGIPASLNVDIYAGYGVSFAGRAAVDFGIQIDRHIEYGVEYRDRTWSTINKHTKNDAITGPNIELSASASAEVWIGPRLSLEVFGSAGVYFDLRPYLRGEIEVDNACRFRREAGEGEAYLGGSYAIWPGVRANLGVYANILGIIKADESWQLADVEFQTLVADTFQVAALGDCCTTDDCDTDSCTGFHKCALDTHTCVVKQEIGCCETNADCDDQDDCTIDGCTDNKRCEHSIKASCQCHDNADCDDDNTCTQDFCTDGGGCFNPDIDGCRRCGSDDDCDDDNRCTTDRCNTAHQCVHAPNIALNGCCDDDSDCGDGDSCTEDRCEGALCIHGPAAPDCCHSDRDCEDAKACVSGTCLDRNGVFDYFEGIF